MQATRRSKPTNHMQLQCLCDALQSKIPPAVSVQETFQKPVQFFPREKVNDNSPAAALPDNVYTRSQSLLQSLFEITRRRMSVAPTSSPQFRRFSLN